MPKLVAVYDGAEIIECPPEYADHMGHIGECSVYESVNKDPGKKWFYFIYDRDQFFYAYFHCGLGEMEEDAKTGDLIFRTHGGEHLYRIEVGEKLEKGTAPWRVVGHGDDAVIVNPDGIPMSC